MQTKHRKNMRVWAAVMAVILLFSYVPEVQAASKAVVTNVKVTNLPSNTLTLKKGKSKTLKVKVEGTKKVSQAVTYKSNKPKVATVTKKGKVTAKKNGTAKITITSKANRKKKAVVQVTVGTPVKSVKLNTVSAELEEGKTLSLKASITPKKVSNKKIIWSTSDKKVATVSTTGVVKAVSAGTAKITAEAADGSEKKSTATITVVKKAETNTPATNDPATNDPATNDPATNDPATDDPEPNKPVSDEVSLKEVSVLSSVKVQVVLTGKKELQKSDFTVKLNSTGGNKYKKECTIATLESTDNKSYLLTLDSKTPIEEWNNVQVTVNGMGSLTTTYEGKPSDWTYTLTYRVDYGKEVKKGLDIDVSGYWTYTVNGIPTGVEIKTTRDKIQFIGTPTQKGKVVSTLIVEDERENTYTYTINWLIQSEDEVYATSEPAYYLKDKDGEDGKAYVDVEILANGGSGFYTYTLMSKDENISGLKMSGSHLNGTLSEAGDYELKVKVEDAKDASKFTETAVEIHVAAPIKVSGTVKDLSGSLIEEKVAIDFENMDKTNKYGDSEIRILTEDGTFSVLLAPGTYNITGELSTAFAHLNAQELTTARSDLEITLPLQKVVITSDDYNFGSWYDENGEYVASGNTFFLKPGEYTLTSTWNSERKKYTATVTLNVTAATIARATAQVTSNTPTIMADQKINLIFENVEYYYYKFTPTETGTYYFYSEGEVDTEGILELEDGDELKYESSNVNGNFYFSYECEADTTYYVGIRSYFYDDDEDSSTLVVSTTKPILQHTVPNGIIKLDTPLSVNMGLEESTKFYEFTPTETGTYHFYSKGAKTAMGILVDEVGQRVCIDEGYFGDFYFSYECEANTTYYVGINGCDGAALGSAELVVSKTRPTEEKLTLEEPVSVTLKEWNKDYYYEPESVKLKRYEP